MQPLGRVRCRCGVGPVGRASLHWAVAAVRHLDPVPVHPRWFGPATRCGSPAAGSTLPPPARPERIALAPTRLAPAAVDRARPSCPGLRLFLDARGPAFGFAAG